MADNMLPTDGEEDEDPFEDFINRDLGMEGVFRTNATSSPDDSFTPRSFSLFQDESLDDDDEDDTDEDDDEEDEPSSRSLPRFGGFSGRLTPSSPNYTDNPFRSPFGRPLPSSGGVFGSSSSGSSASSSRFGSRPAGSFGSVSLGSRVAATPPVQLKGWARMREQIGLFIVEEILTTILVMAALLVILSTMLYIDNLRLSIALRDGQVQELRAQVEYLQGQITPVAPLATPSSR